jgi:TPR repeat protein
MKRLMLTLCLLSALALPACTAESRVAAVRSHADTGDARAAGVMGEMYANGTDVNQDYNQAAAWWRKSAERGLPQAQYNLGVLYERGQGVPKSEVEARAWYQKAASQGLAAAEFNMGVYAQQGRGGVARDENAAISWYTKAAEQGNADAQYNLAALYAARQDNPDALYWLDVLAGTGDPEAARMRGKVAEHVSAAQAADANHRARAFRPVVVTGG